MVLTGLNIQNANVSGVGEHNVVMSKVAIYTMSLARFINSVTSTTINSPYTTGVNITLYACYMYARNNSCVNLTISKNPYFTKVANQITRTNATINASYQKTGSFSMNRLNPGFSFLNAYVLIGDNHMVIKCMK